MKRIEELEISPTPWKAEFDGDKVLNIRDSKSERIVETDSGFYGPKKHDAILMENAPLLYECLFEAVSDICKRCPKFKKDTNECFSKEPCKCDKWRDALYKSYGCMNPTRENLAKGEQPCTDCAYREENVCHYFEEFVDLIDELNPKFTSCTKYIKR